MLNLKTTIVGLVAVTCGVFSTFLPARGASFLTNSQNVFDDNLSLQEQQGNQGWYYGYDNGNGFQKDLNPSWGNFTSLGGFLNGQDTPQWIVRRWKSNFNGTISLSALMPETDSAGSGVDFKKKILVDGHSLLSQDSTIDNGHSIYNLDRIDVNVGSVIDLAFAPTASSWSGDFDLMAKIKAPSGLIFLNQYPGSSTGHVGLLANNQVYEANPKSGVQVRSFNEFIQSSSGDPLVHEFVELPELVAQAMEKHIKTKLGAGYLQQKYSSPLEQKGYTGFFTNAGLIEWAAEQAQVNGGQGFLFNHLEIVYGNGLTCIYSCSNLLPRSLMPAWTGTLHTEDESNFDVLEKFAIQEDLSFIEFDKQTQKIQQEIEKLLRLPITTRPDIVKFPVEDWIFYWDFTRMKNFSPYELKLLIEPFKTASWLQGALNSVDFILTDPLGRKMGYTQGLGFFNEIPNLLYSSQNMLGLENAEGEIAPLIQLSSLEDRQNISNENLCSQDEPINDPDNPNIEVDPSDAHSQIFNFSILNRLPGEYKIEQIGRNKNSKSTIDDGRSTTVTHSDPCDPTTIIVTPSPINPDVDVPEPSTILGLIVLGLLGVRIKKRR